MAHVATNATFADILAQNHLVMIDFWATWCGPCRILSPLVDEIADEMADTVFVAKCNVDDCEDIAVQYGIRSIPTLLFFKDGELVDRSVGAVPKNVIVDKINSLI